MRVACQAPAAVGAFAVDGHAVSCKVIRIAAGARRNG
jgi:hypothetical protein